MHITRSHCPISVSYHMGDTRLETISTHKHLGIVLSSNLEWGPHVDEVASKAKHCSDLFRGLLILMILSPWRNCLLLSLNQSLIIVHRFGLQTEKVTNISWKGFRGVSLDIAFPTRFPGPCHSYDTRLRTLGIHTTNSRFDYFRAMFVVGCLWGKYDISWEDNTKVNTSTSSISRQAVNVVSVISGAELMLTIIHCLFHLQEFGPPYPMMSKVKLFQFVFVFAQVASMCVHLSLTVCLFVFSVSC